MDDNPEPTHPPKKGDIYIVPDGIRPELQPTGIEMLIWGVRNMRKYQLANVTSPVVQVEIGGEIVESDTISNVKRTPNFANTTHFLRTMLPKQQLYMPPINIKVRDNRAFGRKPLVGSHEIADLGRFRVDALLEAFDPLKDIPGKPIHCKS